jgi:glycerol-1-phosphate dehydrogenase [NAD(P)+]
MMPVVRLLPGLEFTPWQDIAESRPVALVCDRAAYEAVKGRLGLDVAWKMEVSEATEESWHAACNKAAGEVVYAVGGGLAVDAAKFIAARRQLPLVCLPTALSVDAFFTWASGVRSEGCVRYVETRPPDRVVVDFEVWSGAPGQVRAAGICDVLSIATGLWDWRYAHERGLNPPGMEYDADAAREAEVILREVLACASSAGRGERDGMMKLLYSLIAEVRLCNRVGHSRPEEGSEHYFAYAVENLVGKGLPHGDLVGPGILLMAALQGQDDAPLRSALEACRIPLRNIPWDVVLATLESLPGYCRRHGLPPGIAHDLTAGMFASLEPRKIFGE